MESSVNIRLFSNGSVLVWISSLGYHIRISNVKFMRNMKYEVYCVLFIVYQFLEGLGMFISSAALVRRLRSYAATDLYITELKS